MKKPILIITILLSTLAVQPAFAQSGKHDPEKQEKVHQMKINYLTQKLNLTADEAQLFWPQYNQYQLELNRLRTNFREERHKSRQNIDKMSDRQLEQYLESRNAFHQQELDLQRKYLHEFKRIIPLRKVVQLYEAEREFKMEVLKQYRKNTDQHSPRPAPHPQRQGR